MKRHDRGSILVLALLVSASSAIAGMWLVLTADLRSRANRYLARAGDATRNAMSGLELARAALGDDPSFDGGTFTLGAAGAPSGGCTVSVTPLGYYRSAVSVVGTLADTTQIVEAELRGPIDQSLEFNVVSATTITFRDAVLDGHIRANGNIVATGDIDFSGTIETLSGSQVTAQIDSSQVAFVDEALPIPDLPLSELLTLCSPMMGVPFDATANALEIENTILTPNSNPFGGLNSMGAYSLDADGRNVILRDLYVRGMIVIHDAGTVTIDSGYHHQRVDPSLPTLVVAGNLDMQLETSLIEAASLIDFNADGDLLDIHSPYVAGIVRASGSLTLPYAGTVHGSAFGQSIVLVGAATLEDDAQLLSFPVRGYVAEGAWDVVAGSVGDGT